MLLCKLIQTIKPSLNPSRNLQLKEEDKTTTLKKSVLKPTSSNRSKKTQFNKKLI